MNRRPHLALVAVLLLVAAAAGCAANPAQLSGRLEQLQADTAAVRQTLSAVAAQRAALDAAIAAMPPGPERERLEKLRDTAGDVIANTSEWLAKADLAMADLRQKLAAATDTLDVIKAAVDAAAPYVPAPWGGLLAALAGLVWGIVQTVRKRSAVASASATAEAAEAERERIEAAAAKVILSVQPLVDKALQADPALANTLDTIQGPEGKALVDAAQDS